MTRPAGSKNTKKKKPNPNNGKGRTDLEMSRDRSDIERLINLGYKAKDIAKKLGLSEAMVSIERKKIREEYREAKLDWHQEILLQEFNFLMNIRQDIAETLERLRKRGKRKTVTKSGKMKVIVDGEEVLGNDEVTETVEDPTVAEHHANLIKTDERICALLGLGDVGKIILNQFFQQNNVSTSVNLFDQFREMLRTPAIAATMPAKEGNDASV